MNLKKYDNKTIRLENIYGDVFEGIGYFNDREYNEHEYGVDEDSIEMDNIITYASQVKSIKVIKEFSSSYGHLEKVVIEDDLSLVEEVFDSEDNISIYRLLLCIEDNISSLTKEKEQLIKDLETLIKYNKDKKIITKANDIIKKKLKEK